MSGANLRSVSPVARGDLVQAVVRFCRLLRHWGVHLSASASQAALEALATIDITRREDFRNALRIAIVQRPEDFALFIYLFNSYWRTQPGGRPQPAGEGLANRPVDAKRLGRDVADPDGESPKGGFQKTRPSRGLEEPPESDGEVRLNRAASRGAGRRPGDGEGDAMRRTELERLARTLSAELATRPSRRHAPAPRGRRPDPRAILRRSLRHGGLPVEMRWRKRRITRSRLVVFVDVSRSMDEHAALFLQFAAAVLRRAWRVEVFLFASDLVRVTDFWLDRSWDDLRSAVADCGGGTRLGECLECFLKDYAPTLPGRGSIVMILSDGLDAGEPEGVASALERLRRRSRSVIWLNPLLAVEGYEPRARGMAAALPYVDVFAPAHDLASLWRVVAAIRALSSGTRARGEPGRDPRARTVA